MYHPSDTILERGPIVLIYNVFGRHIGIKREGVRWLVFRADLTERKFSRLYDIAIPDNMTEDVGSVQADNNQGGPLLAVSSMGRFTRQ